MEKYKDLEDFKEIYDAKIDDFLNKKNESRVVILDADYGWGKTTFVKEILKVESKNIYSPWMSQKENYIDDLYYYTNNIDIGKLTLKSFIIVAIISIIVFFGTIFINDWIDSYKSNQANITYSIKDGINIKLDEQNDLLKEAGLLALSSLVVSVIVVILIKTNKTAYMKILKKEYSSNFEEKLIDKIIKKVNHVLVIEDIDRLDNIEEILILIKRISDRMMELDNKENNKNKYILLTGEYSRLINCLNKNYNVSYGYIQTSTPGACIVEKVVGCRIVFLDKEERIESLLKEFKIDTTLTKIEKDEIISFINNKQLSVRFFVNFLKEHYNSIKPEDSLFYLLTDYYYNNKVVNLDKRIWEKSIFNLDRVPTCLNDLELILEKKKVRINDKTITFDDIGIGNRSTNIQFNIINEKIRDLFINKDENSVAIFKDFYNNDIYPILDKDRPNTPNQKYNIGNNAKPDMICNFLKNYLISYGNNDEIEETMFRDKRCYFYLYNTGSNYEKFFPQEIIKEKTKLISNDDFIIAYTATFFRENIDVISKYYPEILKTIDSIK